MSSHVTSRKRGGVGDDEVEPLKSTSTTNNNPNDNNNYREIFNRTNKFLFIVVVILFALVILSPSNKKEAQKLTNDKKLRSINDSIKKQKGALSKKYEELTSKVNIDLKSLGLIKKSYHDEELLLLQSNHTEEINKIKENHDVEKGNLEKEMQDLKESHGVEKSKLEADLAEKKKQIDALNAEIANSKKEMTDVKSEIDAVDSDAKLFCANCPFHCQGMKVSCGARLAYIMSAYPSNAPEDDYKEGVIKLCPTCKGNSP